MTLVVPGIGTGLVLAVVWVRLIDPSWSPTGGVEALVYTITAATAFFVALLAAAPSARRRCRPADGGDAIGMTG